MSAKGGYQILDLKKTPLTSGTQKTIAGSFDALDRASQKRVIISGLHVGTAEYADIEGYFIPSVNVSTGKASGYNGALSIGTTSLAINVNASDGVTVTVS